MAKLEKKLQKSTKKLSKQLFSKHALTLTRSHTSTTSLCRGGKEGKPYMTVTISGNYKISIIKLFVAMICILSTATLVMLFVRSVQKRISAHRLKKHRRKMKCECFSPDDDEMPF